MAWTLADIPNLQGRTALVTGATGGLGLETARELARHGARVLLAGRSPDKGKAALEHIRDEQPKADISFEPVELGDLATVRSLAQRAGAQGVDILVNNAGIMGVPQRETTQGFEAQLGVNYLSHFVLTGSMLEALRSRPGARVVALSSLAHRMGKINFDDLQSKQGYKPMTAYAQSKLAMLMFALELQRRSDRHGWGLVSTAAHPGASNTNLMRSDGASNMGRLAEMIAPKVSQSAARGAEPILLAATRPDVRPASYWGPAGFMEIMGPAAPAKVSGRAADPAAAARLWDASQALTDNPFGEGA